MFLYIVDRFLRIYCNLRIIQPTIPRGCANALLARYSTQKKRFMPAKLKYKRQLPRGCANELLARFIPAKDVVGGRAMYKPATIFVVVKGTIPKISSPA